MLPGPSSPSDHSCSCNRRPQIGVLPAYILRSGGIFGEGGVEDKGSGERILARRQNENDLIHRTYSKGDVSITIPFKQFPKSKRNRITSAEVSILG